MATAVVGPFGRSEGSRAEFGETRENAGARRGRRWIPGVEEDVVAIMGASNGFGDGVDEIVAAGGRAAYRVIDVKSATFRNNRAEMRVIMRPMHA